MKNGFFSLVVASILLSNLVFAQEETSKFYVGAGYGSLHVIKEEDDTNFSRAGNAAVQFGYKFSKNFSIEAQYSNSIKSASGKVTIEDLNISNAWWQATLPLNAGATLSEIQQWFPYALADATMNLEAKVETTALYGAYRSGGDLYLKAKAGYISAKAKMSAKIKSADVYVANPGGQPIEFNTTSGDEVFDDLGLNQSVNVSDSESNFSAGLGVGYKFNSSLFSELEYTRISGDLNFWTLSMNYAF